MNKVIHRHVGWRGPVIGNIYLAGKMTGLKDYNYSAFIDTTADIRDLTGYHIVHTACMPRGLRWQDYIDFSLQLIRFCQAIAVLPNSEDSFGVKHELDFAREQGLPIFYLDEGYDALINWAREQNQ